MKPDEFQATILLALPASPPRDAIRAALAGDGHTLHTADGFAGTVDAVWNVRPKLVILDGVSQSGGADDICRTLRALPGIEVPNILVMVPAGDDDAAEAALDAGAADIITSPFRPSVLVRRVRQMLRALAAEYRSRETENLLRLLADSMNDVVAVTTPDREVLYVSPSYYRLTGFTPEEIRSSDFSTRVHPDDLPLVEQARQANLRGESTCVEWRCRRRDGSYFVLETTANPIVGADGRVEKIAVCSREVTRRREAEDRLRSVLTDLARSNADLEQFASAVGHDLQEPLRSIAGCVNLLARRQGLSEADAREYLGFAYDASVRMQKMIQDLLDYARAGSGRTGHGTTDLNVVLADAAKNLRSAFDEAGAVVAFEPLPIVAADPGQLLLLFQNLVGNAVKFHRPGVPPQVRVWAERRSGSWLIRVSDNGIGIAAEHRDRVFGIFQRLHDVRRYPGTGIGLALCKRIVERHGGTIRVETNPGGGSIFSFALPDVPAESPAHD